MKKALTIAALGALMATGAAMPAHAQTITDPAGGTQHQLNRENRQDDRISHGVQSGALNQREAYRLQKGQARVDDAQAIAASDGSVTNGEKRKIQRMQDRQSDRIHNQKHDGQAVGQ